MARMICTMRCRDYIVRMTAESTPRAGPANGLKKRLDELYARYNHRSFISPDPLEIVYHYRARRDREVAGLIAALLAYGGVKQIVGSATDALKRLGSSPAARVAGSTDSQLRSVLSGFRHRWTSGNDLAALLAGAGEMMRRYGDLEQGFLAGLSSADATVLPALSAWVGRLRGGRRPKHDLLSCPRQGSACKRLNLFLRWMVRKDDVDPGLWAGVRPSLLVVPLDLHIFRVARAWKLTRRRQANLKTVLEITEAFRGLSPADPVRYDFCITRASMRGETWRPWLQG